MSIVKNSKKQDSEIVNLIGDIYQSVIMPEHFMDILASWNQNVLDNKSVEQNTLDKLEMQLKSAVPMIENSFKDLVSQDDLICQVRDETNPSILISNKNLIVGANESGRIHFNIEVGDEFDCSKLLDEDVAKYLVVLNSTAAPNNSDQFVLSLELGNYDKLKRNLVSVKTVCPSYSDAKYLVMSAIGIQLVGKSRELFKSTFSLTETELELIDQLIQGQGPKRISELRNCREDTVKKQFKAIREKTMCDNSTALVCLVASFTQIHTGSQYDDNPDEKRSITNSANQTYTMPTRNKLVKLGSFHLEYCEYGPSHLRPILMQNFTVTGYVLAPDFIEALIKRGYRLIVVFRPGYGMSTPLEKDGDYNEVARRIVKFSEFKGLNNYACISGTIGLLHALAFIEQQNKNVVGLVSISSFLPVKKNHLRNVLPSHHNIVQTHLKSNWFIAKFLLLGGYRLLLQFGPYKFLSKIMKDSQSDLAVIGDAGSLDLLSVGLKAAMAQGIDALIYDATLVGTNWMELVENTNVPIKLIHGDDDTMFTVEFVEEFCSKHEIEVEFLKNTGHLTMYAKPKTTANFIADFFDQQEGWK